MKQIIIAALLATAVLAERDYEAMFRDFKATHLKAYANEAEESKRFKVFVENMKKSEVLQAANPLATFGANEFADMSAAEFKVRHNADRHFKAAASAPRKNVAVITDAKRKAAAGQSIDWRTKGAVTPVKNQGQCGSCWSFSTTGNIEGQWFLAGNTLTSLSEQELVSCDTTDDGCDGGLPTQAMAWLISSQNGQSVTEASDEYNSGTGFAPSCPSNLASLPVGATISSYTNIGQTEDDMAAYCLANGPVSIGVDATSFQTYNSGILTNCISQQVDHAVLIVGYDDTNVPPYWIIKNSWGASWGEAGYIRVQKGTDQCLITTFPSSAIVSSSKQ